jgi:tetratricopeptide (TPR) repeat protein
MKRVVMLLVWICITSSLHATDLFLIPTPSETTPLHIEAFGSTQTLTASRVQLPARFLVLVNLDGMSAEDWERTKAALTQLRLLSGKDPAGRLFWRNGGNLFEIPWDTPDQLKVQLANATPAASPDGDPDWTPYSEMLRILPEHQEEWEALIVIDKVHNIESKATREYLQSLSSFRIRQSKYRLFSWNLASADAVWKSASNASCGADLTGMDSPMAWLDRIQQSDCASLTLQTPEISTGFIPYTAGIPAPLQSIVLPKNFGPPAVPAYLRMVDAFAATQAAYAANNSDAFHTALQETLGVNPMHAGALLLGADAYEKTRDWETSLRLLEPVALITPSDAALQRRLGNLSYEMSSWEKSEKFYRASLSLEASQPEVLERLSLIREQLHDDEGALTWLDQTIKLQPDRLGLVLRQGTLLDRMHRPLDAAESYEAALRLGALDDTRIHLIEIHQANGNAARAGDLLKERTVSVPNDLNLRMRYAGIAEGAARKDIALTYYTLAAASDARHEPAHFGRARLLLDAGNVKDAHEAVAQGLEAAPSSGRLHAMNIDLFEKENRIFDARIAATTAGVAAPADREVLRRQTRINDVFGDHAGTTFARYAALLDPATDSATLRETLERGVTVSLRDGDADSAKKLAARLLLLGDTKLFGVVNGTGATSIQSSVTIPGGMKGFSQAVGLRLDLPPKRYLQEYVQAVLQSFGFDKSLHEKFDKSARFYVDTVRALKVLGRPGTSGVDIRLETQTSDGYSHTERVLDLLGWKIHRSRGKIELEVANGEKNTVRQSFASGLSIDEAEMKIRMEAGSDFTFTIHDDQVPLILSEKFWSAVAPSIQFPGDMLIEFLNNRSLARLYNGLASMSRETQQAVVENVDRQLLVKRAAYLAIYGSSIIVRNGAIVLPGGDAAAAGWEHLVGISPKQTRQFLTNLLNKDDGKLLSYYYTLAAVPSRNQAFFTKSPTRLAAFYKAFPFNDADLIDRGVFFHQDDYFSQLTRELPLSPDGSIHFPGSPRVWMLNKDPSGSMQDIEKLETQLGRISTVPKGDAEDAILMRMMDRDISIGSKKINQTEIFLAAVRIDIMRVEPMDEVMALALSQTYPKYGGLYPYIAALPALSGKDLVSFFRAAERIESFGDSLNVALGEFHAVTKLVLMLGESGCLSDKQSVEVLSPMWQKIAAVHDASDMTTIVFASLESMMSAAGRIKTERADDFLARALTGEKRDRTFSFDGEMIQVNRVATRTSRIQNMLRLQSIGPLQDLLDIYDAAVTAASNPAAGTGGMDAAVSMLREPRVVTSAKIQKVIQDQLESEKIADVAKAVKELKKEIAKTKPKGAPRLSEELIQSLDAFLEAELVGWVYAYYLSPEDLVPSSDPLLVRKQLFIDSSTKDLWPTTHVVVTPEYGTYVSGGLAQFEAVAGQMGISRLDPAESAGDSPGRAIIAAEIAAIRGAPWQKMDDSMMHFIALNLRLGREFVIQSGFHPEVRDELAEAATGLIGLQRRSELMDSIADLDFKHGFSLLSSSDLYFLADAYRKLKGAALPGDVDKAVKKESVNIAVDGLHGFGGSFPTINGSTHNRLLPLGPYEEYDKLVFAEPLSERLSHILLDLAEAVDVAGLPVDAMSLLAEPAARQLSSKVHMTSKDDWMSAIEAMHDIDIKALIPSLQKGAR